MKYDDEYMAERILEKHKGIITYNDKDGWFVNGVDEKNWDEKDLNFLEKAIKDNIEDIKKDFPDAQAIEAYEYHYFRFAINKIRHSAVIVASPYAIK